MIGSTSGPNRLRTVEDLAAGGTAVVAKASYAYDGLGRILKETGLDPNGNVKTATRR